MKKRNGFQIMAGLIGMIRPLLLVMTLAILMGCLGHLCAIAITVLGAYGMMSVGGFDISLALPVILLFMGICAVLRGCLRYAEQASNHYIAFRLLADIRHKIFAKLRKLAPAKLEGKEKGNLISILTSDIELLEVFYAHTISPIAIAILTSVLMSVWIGSIHAVLGWTAVGFYFLVGFIIPSINGACGREKGKVYRKQFGTLNSTVLDHLYGMEDILQYQQEKTKMGQMQKQTIELEQITGKLKNNEAKQRIATDWAILTAGAVIAMMAAHYVQQDVLSASQALIAVVAMMSSFGPVAALSALSNDLNQTLASGDRVLHLLEEEPIVKEVTKGQDYVSGEVLCEQVSFSYEQHQKEKKILNDFNLILKEKKLYGILGKSGCGKSTLLKLLMRFQEPQKGCIRYGTTDVNDINTSALFNHVTYVTQDTFLFEDTIENNIKLANLTATREEIIKAAKRASIHEFIESLPHGYETKLSELGDGLSGGEKQRIGIARAFLHNANMILLDEPTSNIDSLNEGIILKSLKKEADNKTIVLVSHRKSTLGIAEEIICLN